MKNNNSKFFKRSISVATALLAVVLAISCMLMLAACGSEVSDIVIKDSNKPRTTYVLGQDLDLSKGVLTAIVDGSEVSIALTDENVTVTGYDKNTLGKQTLTVTYEEKTTTLEVNVVERMVASGFKSDYFIGGAFDSTQGRLKITKDDGTSTNVNFNDEAVTFSGFNSSAAGTSTVTASYSKDGVSYTATFNVNIHSIGNVSFTKPSKTVYQSHESASLNGGYFTVTASDSDITAFVDITPDMIKSGFDFSAATAANRVTPLEQTVVFTYAGRDFEFKISILYSSVSVVKDAAEALKDINVTSRDTVISPELSAIAVDAANEYFKLTQARKSLITEEEALAVMRPAALCVYRLFLDAAEPFANTFTVNTTTGNLDIYSVSYSQLEADIVEFQNGDNDFNTCAVILNHMKDEFKDVFLFTEVVEEKNVDVTISGYLKSPSNDELSFYKDLFQYMLNVSDYLKDIPDNWTNATLSSYDNQITQAFAYITGSSYHGPNFNSVYNSISSWRTEDDYFEIIYTYYLEVLDKDSEFLTAINSTNGFRFPMIGALQPWYTYLYNANTELAKMTYRNYDTTRFMYYYTHVYESRLAINDAPQLYKDIYNLIGGDQMIYQLLEHPATYGYLFHNRYILESEDAAELWNDYLALASIYLEGRMENVQDYAAEFNAVLASMAKLSPSELFGFMSSLSFFYGDESSSDIVYLFNGHKTDVYYAILPYLMAFYDANSFGEDAILMQLLFAMERCAVREYTADGVQGFKDEMKAFLDLYNALTPDEQTAFDAVAGALRLRYTAIYDSYASTTLPTLPELGESASKFNELKNTVEDFYTAYSVVYGGGASASNYYTLLFALSEKALDLYYDLINNGTDGAKLALTTVEYTIANETMTLDAFVTEVKVEFYANILNYNLNFGTDANPINVSLWLTYASLDLREFMIQIADVLMAAYNGETISAADMQAMLEAYRALGVADKNIFSRFGVNIYYDTVSAYFASENANVVKAILQAEIGYVTYSMDPTESGRQDFFDSQMKAAASALTAAGVTVSDLDQLLQDMYNHYLELYEEFKTTYSPSHESA